MKTIFNFLRPAIIILGASTFIFSGCPKVETHDPCDDTERPLIEASFNLKTQIQYADSVPYEGTVTLIIWKNYCDGYESGRFTKKGDSDANGYWNSYMTYSYKFENTMDRVSVNLLMKNGNIGSTSVDYYYYADVESNKYVNKTYNITLPFKSTD